MKHNGGSFVPFEMRVGLMGGTRSIPPFPVMKKACAAFDLHLTFRCIVVSLHWMLQHSFVFRVNSIILR